MTPKAIALGGFEDFEIHEEGMSRDDFLAAYVADRRSVEIDGLRAIADGMQEVQSDVWMLTVVAKQDLWWDEKTDVKAHYSNKSDGGYSKILSDIEDSMTERARFLSPFCRRLTSNGQLERS